MKFIIELDVFFHLLNLNIVLKKMLKIDLVALKVESFNNLRCNTSNSGYFFCNS